MELVKIFCFGHGFSVRYLTSPLVGGLSYPLVGEPSYPLVGEPSYPLVGEPSYLCLSSKLLVSSSSSHFGIFSDEFSVSKYFISHSCSSGMLPGLVAVVRMMLTMRETARNAKTPAWTFAK